MEISKSTGDASLEVGLMAGAVPETTSASTRPESVRWGHLTATFFVLLLFSWLGIVLSRQSDGVATIWFTNGLLFALIVTRPKKTWLPYFVAGFLADVLADVVYGDPLKLAVGVSVANSVEVITSAILLTRWFGNPLQLTKRIPLLGFLGVAVVGATAVTSALGASWTMLFVNAGPWWMLFRTWYLGDVLGMAIIAPLVFILQRPGFFSMLHREQLPKTLLFLMIPAAATALVFSHSKDPLIFFIFPALLLVVFRLGFPGTVLSVFVIALISICFTVTGHGPLMLITGANLLHKIVIEQIFVAVALFTFFPVAALLEERKALETSLQKSELRYRELANADSLTGLANRRAFDERLEQAWDRAMRHEQSLALLLVDVDLFKAYNDLYGHVGGDDCLRCIAKVIASALQDKAEMAARFGGEEFAVILPNTTMESAVHIAEDVRQAVAAMKMPHSGNQLGIQTISIGVAAGVPDRNAALISLLTASDHALYRAKYLGRNRVESTMAVMASDGMSTADSTA
ncbi:GGDEF domain-containing protein [Granulicella sp. S190]|uniref:MASE1 domain-containing protein n=1 Tax=Granulicella sp. S190 TaxID=1747226 RepID=UPI00131B0F65|nr:GGDEF domain-containing protein [Granulicella sp. S190]